MHVSFEQSQAYFTHGSIDIALREFAAPAELFENGV
jgi:hypothetical protein